MPIDRAMRGLLSGADRAPQPAAAIGLEHAVMRPAGRRDTEVRAIVVFAGLARRRFGRALSLYPCPPDQAQHAHRMGRLVRVMAQVIRDEFVEGVPEVRVPLAMRIPMHVTVAGSAARATAHIGNTRRVDTRQSPSADPVLRIPYACARPFSRSRA